MNQPHKLWTILLGSATIAIIQSQNAIAQLSPQQVDSIAREVTVRIDGSGGGSGVIIERQGDTYFVLTNHHVVRQSDRYEIQTPDGDRYSVHYGQELPGFDLALIQFKSDKNYRVAELGNSDQLKAEDNVYATGFPTAQPGIEKRSYQFTVGKFLLYQPGGDNGYTMVYNNEIVPGMSGGPIFDVMGRVVGVNGRSCKLRFGIPINSFLANKKKLQQLQDTSVDQTRQPSADDWLSSGGGKADKGDYLGAIADYKQALQICPDNADAYLQLGYAQVKLNNYEAAIENYNQVLRINPNHAKAYNGRGNTYY
jgi:tetratricopeptide (TPR) repeat protein